MNEQPKRFQGRIRKQLASAAVASVIAAVCPLLISTAGASKVKSNHQPITVGVIASLTGSDAPTWQPKYNAFVAVVNWANAHGGVNGHLINLVTQTDSNAAGPSSNLSAAQSLVRNRDAFLVVDLSAVVEGGAPFLSQAGVPVIAQQSTTADSEYSNIFTPIGGDNTNPTVFNTSIVTFMKRIGVKRLGSLSIANATAAAVSQEIVAAAPKVGLKKGYLVTTIPIGNPDWTPYVLGFQNTNTDGVVTNMDVTNTLLFYATVQQQGLQIKFLSPSIFVPSLLTGPSASTMQGAYVDANYDPNLSSPPVKQMTSILANYGDATGAVSPATNEAQGYTIGLLTLEALKIGGVNPTRSAVIRNLSHLTNWSAGGMYGHPINFALEHTAQAPVGNGNCLWFLQVRGASFVTVNKGKPICTKTVRLSF